MDIYADKLFTGLNANGVDCQRFIPSSSLEKFSGSRILMRYLRYAVYPLSVALRRSTADIHHVTDHGYAHLFPCLGKGKKVVSVHDLIPLLSWKGVIKVDEHGSRKPILNLHSLGFLKKFDNIVTISQSTANDLEEHLALDPKTISVVPPVISDYFQPQDTQKVSQYRQRLCADASTRLVLITGRENYKNQRTSLKVIKTLIDQGHSVKLLRTGLPDPSFMTLADRIGVSQHVESIYLEEHRELALLYCAIDCLLFPSWYEGFGMPVAEVLACGTAVVTSDAPAVLEAGGELALSSGAGNVEALSELVLRCFHDRAHRDRVATQGPQWVEQFRAGPVVDRLVDAYGV